MPTLLSNVRVTLEMIKIEHTLLRCRLRFSARCSAANGAAHRLDKLLLDHRWRWLARARRRWRSIESPIANYDARNPRTAIARTAGRTAYR
mgnify:CR=1 FL=1